MTPLASVAMLEKLALLKIAFCRARVVTIDSSVWRGAAESGGVVMASHYSNCGRESLFYCIVVFSVGCPKLWSGRIRISSIDDAS